MSDTGLAALSGVLLGCAFPPADWKWLVWIGLVPLLFAIEQSRRPRQAFLFGYLAGLVFFLLTLHPLVSVHAWTGWSVESQGEFATRMSRQWWFMQGIWLSFSVWCALFWGAWAAALRRLAGGRLWRTLLLGPSLWVLLPEWARAQTTFGFTWAVLGNATADLPAIRQLAALGGVWLPGALVVFVNVALVQTWRLRGRPEGRRAAVALLGLLILAIGYGVGRQVWPASAASRTIQVGAIQHTKDRYVVSDFLPIGLDRTYPRMIEEALARSPALLVLPESIALGAIVLDSTASHTKPPERQIPLERWTAALQPLLQGHETVVLIGVDTVEQRQDHNTLVAWTAEGPAGWYHKRRLVPFSEYIPWGWGRVAIRGRSQYAPGQGSQLVRHDGLVLGGFICQEVLFPWVTRQSVREGATILVSGGNDGVFADPAVAHVHADAAQLRAAETGRPIVRAMKTGISAIIDAQGGELVRSRSAESVLLLRQITPQAGRTPYVRFGDWMVWISLVPILGCAILRRRDGY